MGRHTYPKHITSKIKKKPMPDWVSPMLATLTENYFSDKDWIYERKLDGQRCLAFKKGKEVNLYSRNHKKINAGYPEIVDALRKIGGDFIIDGELVAFEGKKTSFARLQPRMHTRSFGKVEKRIDVFYYVFDLIHDGTNDLQDLALIERKKILKKER